MTDPATVTLHLSIHRLGPDDFNDSCDGVECVMDDCKVIPVYMVESSAFVDEDGEWHAHCCGEDLLGFLTGLLEEFKVDMENV